MLSIAQIMDHWETAEALGEDVGLSGNAVRKWRLRNSIPAEYFAAIAGAAQRRGYDKVTLEALAGAASERLRRKPPSHSGDAAA